jgi:nitrite reductase/ring-hydroxylating ferredoxin subunit
MEWIKVFNSEKEALSILNLNSVRKITVKNKEYCLIRNSKGLFVTSNFCSHDGGILSQGKCTTAGTIECPWHHYLFDPSSGECINHECGSLETFSMKINEEGVFFEG